MNKQTLYILGMASLVFLGAVFINLRENSKTEVDYPSDFLSKVQEIENKCTNDNDSLLLLVNKFRYDNGISMLNTSQELIESATWKSNDIVEKDYFSHTNPEGKKFYQAILEAGYKYSHSGENLAKDFNCDSEVVKAWINSQTHKENMLAEKFRDAGIGRNGTVITIHFGAK